MVGCTAQLVLNHLVVQATGPRSARLCRLVVTGPDGNALFAFDSGAGTPPGGALGLAAAGRSFARQDVVCTLTSAWIGDLRLLSRLHGGGLQVTVQFEHQVETLSLAVGPTGLDGIAALPPAALRKLGEDAFWAGLVAALGAGRVLAVETGAVHVDYAYRADDVLFLSGRLPNFAGLDVYVLTDGAAHVARGSEAIGQPRPDIGEPPRGGGPGAPATDTHGFSVVLPMWEGGGAVTIGILKGGVFHTVFRRPLALAASRDAIFPLVLAAHQASAVPLARITRMIAPFLEAGGGDGGYGVRRRARPDAAVPAVSVVIPFYREWRFLYAILAMARNAPRDWEWVLVCDDPDIARYMGPLIAGSPEALRDRLTFIVVRGNLGYGGANNVGVQEARSAAVLLMNSDIWLADFRCVERALAALAAGDYALLGFTLLFEDGTVQHDGLAFRRSAAFDGRYLAQHPGKGLPPEDLPPGGEIVPAGAVTGAMMLLARQLFLALGGFDKRYVGGDFEDADLCLAVAGRGQRIGLVRSRSAFHLERQSIRRDAANDLAFARTLVNCERFNARWAAELDMTAPRPAVGGAPCPA